MQKNLITIISLLLMCAVSANAQSDSISTSAAPEAVDLGLPSGTLWAACNVGANAPEEYGDYYAWGETETKASFKRDEYSLIKPGQENVMPIRRAFIDLGKDLAGTKYDIATQKLGDGWQMPSITQAQELEQYCTWEWTSINGTNGYKVVSKKNGNSIFFPAAGSKASQRTSNMNLYGLYWLSTMYSASDAYNWLLQQGSDQRRQMSLRSMGYSVRAVKTK